MIRLDVLAEHHWLWVSCYRALINRIHGMYKVYNVFFAMKLVESENCLLATTAGINFR